MDLVVSAFGFRNLANYDAGLREIFRVLKPQEKSAYSISANLADLWANFMPSTFATFCRAWVL